MHAHYLLIPQSTRTESTGDLMFLRSQICAPNNSHVTSDLPSALYLNVTLQLLLANVAPGAHCHVTLQLLLANVASGLTVMRHYSYS